MAGLREPWRLLFTVAMLGFLALLSLDWAGVGWPGYVIRGALAAAAIAVFVGVIVRFHADRLAERPMPFPKYSVPLKNVNALKRRTGTNALFDAEQLLRFAEAVAEPAAHRQRVADTYTTTRRTLRQQTRIEGRLRDAQTGDSSYVYLPIVIIPKGRLGDSFRVRDGNGEELATLAYSEYLELVACALRLLLLSAYSARRASELKGDVIDAESLSLARIQQRRWNDDFGDDDHSEAVPENPISRLINMIEEKPTGALRLAHSLVDRLSSNYAIVARVPVDNFGRFIVMYEQEIIPDLETIPNRSGLGAVVLRAIRFALGAGPVTITIGIENASTCRSYHLQLIGPDGMYLQRQIPIEFVKTIQSRASNAPTLPHLRFRKRLGQSYAHFYTRFFPAPDLTEYPRIQFKFAEVPPGVQFRALMSSVAVLGTTWLAAALSESDRGTLPSELPFLLVLPAYAAAAVGVQSSTRRLLEGTLRARFSLMLTVLTSLCGSGLCVWYRQMPPPIEIHLPAGMYFGGVGDILWLTLLTICLLNTCYIGYKYWLHTYEYAYFSGREQ